MYVQYANAHSICTATHLTYYTHSSTLHSWAVLRRTRIRSRTIRSSEAHYYTTHSLTQDNFGQYHHRNHTFNDKQTLRLEHHHLQPVAVLGSHDFGPSRQRTAGIRVLTLFVCAPLVIFAYVQANLYSYIRPLTRRDTSYSRDDHLLYLPVVHKQLNVCSSKERPNTEALDH